MLKMFRTLAVMCALGAAPSAFAIPFGIQITASPYVAGGGSWSLSGPTSASDVWAVGFGGSYSGGADVVAGQYTWNLFGGGVGLGSISWVLTLGGQQIYSGQDSGFLAFLVSDTEGIKVGPAATSVPAPGALILLGSGLLGVAFSLRRRSKA